MFKSSSGRVDQLGLCAFAFHKRLSDAESFIPISNERPVLLMDFPRSDVAIDGTAVLIHVASVACGCTDERRVEAVALVGPALVATNTSNDFLNRAVSGPSFAASCLSTIAHRS
jgi:hypothetical protein